jgi:hypothetical protein
MDLHEQEPDVDAYLSLLCFSSMVLGICYVDPRGFAVRLMKGMSISSHVTRNGRQTFPAVEL